MKAWDIHVSKIQKRLFFDNHDNANFCLCIVASCLYKVCTIRRRNLEACVVLKERVAYSCLIEALGFFSVKETAPTSVIEAARVFLPSS